MLVLPTVLIALGGASGAGGLALSVKSVIDSINASATDRESQRRNDQNIQRFEAVSRRLEDSLDGLGRQRFVISKNFRVFVDAYSRIHNRPEFTTEESPRLPRFKFDEIEGIVVIADALLGSAVGAAGGSIFATAAATGTTQAVMAFGTASTGAKIASLHGAAATRAALAAIGGGALSANGGGMALGMTVLNVASLGVGVLVEGLAMSYAASLARKKADEARQKVIENERVIADAIDMQLELAVLADRIAEEATYINNRIYKPLVLDLKKLVDRKQEWYSFTAEEKTLVENNIMVIQLLHHLNNIPLYKVTKTNRRGEVEEVEINEGARTAANNARRRADQFRR